VRFHRRMSERQRLKRNGQAVELEVDEVALGVAGLAAGGNVGAAGLLDGDGHCRSSLASIAIFFALLKI